MAEMVNHKIFRNAPLWHPPFHSRKKESGHPAFKTRDKDNSQAGREVVDE